MKGVSHQREEEEEEEGAGLGRKVEEQLKKGYYAFFLFNLLK